MLRKAEALGKAIAQSSQRSEHYARTYRRIPIEDILPNPAQPRRHFDERALQDLADSIARVGLLNPIIVEHADGKYRIVAGDRRYRACKMAGMSSIPALILEPNHAPLEVSLIENLQREDLHPLEEARAFDELLQAGLTQEELGARIGKSNVYVSETLGLLRLVEKIQAEWFLNREIAPKYKMKKLSTLNEIEQLRAWVLLTARAKDTTAPARAGANHSNARPPPPKRVFSRVARIAEFLDTVDVSRWKHATRAKLLAELDRAEKKITFLRERLST